MLRVATYAVVVVGLATGSGIALAKLSETPPKGVVLDGTWALDKTKSDDAEAVINRARDNERGGRANSVGAHGGGMAGGGGHHSGGGRHGHQAPTSDDDAGSIGQAPTPTPGAHSGMREDILTELSTNPGRLSVETHDRALMIAADAAGFECEPGTKGALEDSLGDAERVCGWDGRAWMVETNRGKSGSRSDRYELSGDGKTLTYTTQVSGGKFPKVKLTRVYRVTTSQVGGPTR